MQLVVQFKALPGQGRQKTKAELNPQTPLLVGSTFKLSLPEALKSEIIQGIELYSGILAQLGASK
jgi:hypothetical protein